jgi:hypothetical protein
MSVLRAKKTFSQNSLICVSTCLEFFADFGFEGTFKKNGFFNKVLIPRHVFFWSSFFPVHGFKNIPSDLKTG